MVSCVPFNPACDAVGIRAEAACNEYIQHVKREIRGRVFRFGVNTGGPLESLPLPMGVPVRLHKIQRNVHPCGFGMTHRGAIDVEVMHDGEFSFTFDDERDVQYCDSPDGNNRACEPKDVFIPGELEVDPNNAWGYRAETTVYYSSEDFNSGKSVYLEVYVYPGRSWWDDDTRHEALTLFPPDGLDAAGKYNGVYDGIPDIHHTNSQLAPLILVHGHGGEAEYWRGIREPLAKPRGYMNLDGMGQMWEVYYPGEEHIEQGAAVLKDGIDTILDQYNNSYTKVDIVAHSMGGPISRAYIAGIAKPENGDWESYDPKVRRLLMLATPNFGVVFAARIRDGDSDCTDLANTFLFHHDPNEPAMRDLAMGSRFFAGLA